MQYIGQTCKFLKLDLRQIKISNLIVTILYKHTNHSPIRIFMQPAEKSVMMVILLKGIGIFLGMN